MKQRTNVVLLATLISATAWGQEVSVYGTTMAQMWKQDIPGFDKASYMPATQFLGIDATKLGTEGLSMHLFGWGSMDLKEASFPDGKKKDGELTYGYMKYRFATANAEIKAGRFAVSDTGSVEQIDGMRGRADLKGGFTLSFFAGTPVLYKPGEPAADRDYAFQRDIIFGTRLGMRVPGAGEFGISYLQDGSKAAMNLPVPSNTDYTRKHLGFDVRFLPFSTVDLAGRTVVDVASHPGVQKAVNPSRFAEHDYSLSVRASESILVNANFVERNFLSYYAGTTMPSLFRQDEKGMFNAIGGNVVIGSASAVQVTADFRYTRREIYGTANRFGGDVKWGSHGGAMAYGAGYHRVQGTQVPFSAPSTTPYYSLSHNELRAWAMFEAKKYSASIDAIYHGYSDENNPALNGKTSLYEVVASVGYRPMDNLKVSGDLSIGATPTYSRDVRGLLKAEFRFGMARKGGK